jgi:hypothetical protein
MPMANSELITVSRRTALGFSVAAFAAGFVPVIARAAAPDAAIVKTCAALLALDSEFEELHDRRLTIEDEHRTEPELVALTDRRTEIEDRLSDMGSPTTPAGAKAMALVAVSRWQRDYEGGGICVSDFDEWVALTVVEYVAGGEAAHAS